jgi:predicted Zn-dependent protease
MNCSFHPNRRAARVTLRVVVSLFVWGTAGRPDAAFAQPFKLPFTDPSKMFEQAFGEDTEADRKALEKIEVSVDEERQLGKQILQSGLASLKESGIKVETKGRDVEYLQSLVATLQPHMRNKARYETIQVMVARSPKIDARSCPGGTLIFFEGLLDAAGSEAALVGIVGHELSHLDRGHQLLPVKRIKLMEKSLSSPQNMTQFMQSGPGMTKLWARPFRPEDERDADRDGVAWAFAAGYDPREMAKLFQKKGGKGPGAEGMPWATFFRSHPYDQERHQAILKQSAQLQKLHPPAAPLFIGRENLENRFSRKQTEEAAK